VGFAHQKDRVECKLRRKRPANGLSSEGKEERDGYRRGKTAGKTAGRNNKRKKNEELNKRKEKNQGGDGTLLLPTFTRGKAKRRRNSKGTKELESIT